MTKVEGLEQCRAAIRKSSVVELLSVEKQLQDHSRNT